MIYSNFEIVATIDGGSKDILLDGKICLRVIIHGSLQRTPTIMFNIY